MEPRRVEPKAVRSTKKDEVSLLALGTTLVRRRWQIVRWMLFGAVAAGLTIIVRPRTYVASASFFSQDTESSRSGLANLAGQIGISIPNGNQSLSPDFYVSLLKSRVVLLPIVRDTITVQELGGRRVTVLDLFKITGASPQEREEAGVAQLQRMVSVSVAKSTGIVQFSIATQWRSASLALVTALLDGVNAYNERTRQSQASSERKFVEGRLALAADELRDAENRLASFQKNNRDFGGSPDLTIGRERLQRDLALRQQVFTTLTQSYEEARIREVRDTPVITVFEPPFAPRIPARRGLVIGVLLGLIVGTLIGTILALTSGLLARRQENGSTDAEEFANALREAKGQLFGGVGRLKVGRRT